MRLLAFWFLFAGFAVKLPVVPVHMAARRARGSAYTHLGCTRRYFVENEVAMVFIRIVDGFFLPKTLYSAIPLAVLGDDFNCLWRF